MLPKETILSGAPMICPEDGHAVTFGIYASAAGYYIGTYCPQCGPYSRESEYYRTRTEIEQALQNDTVRWRSRGWRSF